MLKIILLTTNILIIVYKTFMNFFVEIKKENVYIFFMFLLKLNQSQ